MVIAATAIGWCGTASAGSGVQPVGEVAYAHAELLFLNLVAGIEIAVGSELDILSRNGKVARAEVVESLPLRAVARLLAPAPWVRPGDTVAGGGATPRASPEAQPVATQIAEAPGGFWVDIPYAKVDRARPLPGPTFMPMRTRAALRGSGWLWLERGGNEFQRDSLELIVNGPLDAAGNFLIDADLRLTGQLLVPAEARNRAEQTVYFDIYRASLTYRGWGPFWLAVGRRPLPGLRWGLVDGAAAGWRFADGHTLEIALGVRPLPDTLWPERFRPVASLGLSGAVDWGGARLSYRLGTSWLGGDQMSTDGLEAAGAVYLDLLAWLGLDGEVGVLTLLPPAADPTVSVDRIGIGMSARLGDRALLRLAARRLEGWGPAEDRASLPFARSAAAPFWDGAGYADFYVGQLGPAALDAAAAGGVIWDETGGEPRGWASPALTIRIPRLLGASFRLGYRLEVGAIGAQLGEAAIGLEPLPGLRLDLWQQGGVWASDGTRAVLSTASTWLRLAWRPLAWLELDLRGRASYGETGTAVEVDGHVAAVDFW